MTRRVLDAVSLVALVSTAGLPGPVAPAARTFLPLPVSREPVIHVQTTNQRTGEMQGISYTAAQLAAAERAAQRRAAWAARPGALSR